jgi:sugar O-acyltransferase (sialic acid O-acetyltransferase NeuD family)
VKRVVIIGAGGHGREVSEILRQQSEDCAAFVLGFIDDEPRLSEQIINGLPVLGNWSWFENRDRDEIEVVCAVGFPEVRRRLVERATALGLSFGKAISGVANISQSAKIGRGVMIFPNTVVSTDCRIGDHSVINSGVTISHDSLIGDYATINPGVNVAGNVSIGEGCYLGVGSSVIHGVSIGAWTVIGGGAVVTKDLPENVTAVGVPARVIKNGENGSYESTAGVAGE